MTENKKSEIEIAQSSDGMDHPICDHRECRPDPDPAVTKFEFLDPPAGTFRAWSCPKHEPDMTAIKRIDPGPDKRTVQTGTQR